MKENNTTVMIELDRVRELRFSHKAMKHWAAFTGKTLGEIEAATQSPEELEKVVFFMLEQDAVDHGEVLRMEQMEDLLDSVSLGMLYEKVGEAITAAFPQAETSEKNAKRAASGIGKKA